MTKSSLLTLSVALALLAGCDFAEKAARDRERSVRDYRVAMDDYQAGRLTQAVQGLEKVCAADPSNASARFQLACLLQDSEKDFAGAFCAYREYLLLAPESEKAKLAKDRLSASEAELAKVLAKKYALDSVDQAADAMKALRQQLAEVRQELEKAQKELGEKARRVAFLEGESARLKSLVRAEGESTGTAPDLSEAKVDDDEDAVKPDLSDIAAAKLLLAEDETDDAPESMDGAKELLAELDDETPMLAQASDAKAKRDAARQAAANREPSEKEKVLAAEEAKLEPLPKDGHYVVQTGDSLYKLANRFYGHTSAWRLIREANKATISTDGRVKVGQKIVLPPRK